MYKWSEFGNSAENKHQRNQQVKALAAFESVCCEFPIQDCGIFIDSELCFLGASPFKLYGDSILTIKCPLKEFGSNINEVIEKLPLWKKQNGNLIINKKSPWFIELQGELRVTDREKALLMIWLGDNNFKIFEIEKDDNFFDTEMKEKLSFFYNECMLKELVDARKARFMDLREYDEELQIFA